MKRKIFFYIFILCVSRLFATDYIVITEIMYDTPLNEDTTKRRHNHGEFIELYNESYNIVDLSGWSLETATPHQVFTIPVGITIQPKSTLIIAYGDENSISYSVGDMTTEEWMSGLTDFHWLYELTDPNLPKVVLQTSFILPNQHTTLLLKNTSGITQDSVIYENPYPGSLDNARNNNTGLIDADAYKGCLNSMYSLQRINVSFVYGIVSYRPSDWLGKFMNSQSATYKNNTLGYIPEYFYVGDYNNNTQTNTSLPNYIQEITPRVAMSNIDTSQILNSPSQATVKRTYYDAMYRPTLTFLFNQSSNQNNLVTLQEYDVYTRPTKEWLPIVTEIDHLTKNTFKSNVEQFYSTESRPFVEQSYSTETWDNGVIKNKVAGLQKAGADMNSHKTAFAIRGNNANEVKLFSVSSDGLLECTGFYQKGMLRVKQTTDEDNKTKVVYTNLSNQIVMEKVDNATTYYVYNDLNQLCYVLPPLAVSQLGEGEYNEDEDILKKYAYIYKYDERGNQIYKRLPGCEPTLMVYDKSNCLVMSQTGNQRARGTFWTVYKYDELWRPIYTAEVNTGSNNHKELIESFRGWHMQEHFSTTGHENPMSNTGYSKNYFHLRLTKLLTVNYYDNYAFLDLTSDIVRSNLEFTAFDGNNSYANAKGLLTGSRTYSMNDNRNYIETVYYYDHRGREIQRRSTNHLLGYNVTSTKYDFTNNIIDTWSSQSARGGTTVSEHYHYTYDHANRLETTTYTFNDDPPIILQSYHYDELGRVRSRHLYGGIDSVRFSYNIRNQITQIKSSGYEQKYYYNQSCSIAPDFSGGLYNGNISATTWTYGNQTNGYVYHYDKMNRLESNYSILNSSLDVDYLYSESFTYDAQGNVTNLARWDNNDLMNYLHLTYDGNQLVNVDDNGFGSYEYATKQYHDNNTEGDDFAYDANGNMLYDKDRGIAAICYNLLNLPDTILFTNGNQIVHFYDAAGNRLKTNYYTRKVAPTSPLENTVKSPNSSDYYITNDVYNRHVVYNSKSFSEYGIEFVHNPEGYIRYLTTEEHYHFYYIKDLLGNIRETYVYPWEGYKECVQRTQYYPSGLPWLEAYSPSEQPYKYNGKEFVEMHGLDEYDSKARWYYPAICRTTTMDPLAEKYYSTSPYAWCGNNPIRNIDPDGRKVVFAKDVSISFKNDLRIAVEYMNKHKISGMLYQLEKSPQTYYIAEGEHLEGSYYDRLTRTITWSSLTGLQTSNGYKMSPVEILNHEIDHALQHDKNPNEQTKDIQTKDNQYKNKEEKRVIEGSEQTTAKKIGKLNEGEVTRNTHKGGKIYETISPISDEKLSVSF